MAVKSDKIRIFESYCSEIPAFKKKKTSFMDQIASCNVKQSQRAKVNTSLNEQVISINTNLLNEKLAEPSGSKSSETVSMNKETPKAPQPCILNIETVQGSESTSLQTSPEVQTSEIDEYDCPYLDHLSTIDFDTGKPYADRIARKKEIIAELKLAESHAVEESPKPPKDPERKIYSTIDFDTGKPYADRITRKKEIIAELKLAESYAVEESPKPPKDPERKKYVNKMKTDCPVCKKLVLAVGFTLHLSKCMGVNTRRSARKPKK